MAWCEGLVAPRLLISPLPSISNQRGHANLEGNILALRHPQSGKPTNYILNEGSLHELHWFKQSYGSWFLGDYVCEDGSLYVSTPVDPIFVLLPIFEEARMKFGMLFNLPKIVLNSKAGTLVEPLLCTNLFIDDLAYGKAVHSFKENDQGMYRQLDEILYVEGYPGYQHLLSMTKDTMKIVCEVKEIGSLQYFRLDNSKVLTWLCCKVQNLKSTYLKLDKNYAAQEERETLKDVVSILGEYVTDKPWLTLLCNHLQLEIGETHKEEIQAETSQNLPESNLASSHAFQSKVVNGRSMVSTKRQPKKMKTETNSKNIRDMFQRATRKGTS